MSASSGSLALLLRGYMYNMAVIWVINDQREWEYNLICCADSV